MATLPVIPVIAYMVSFQIDHLSGLSESEFGEYGEIAAHVGKRRLC